MLRSHKGQAFPVVALFGAYRTNNTDVLARAQRNAGYVLQQFAVFECPTGRCPAQLAPEQGQSLRSA